MVRKIIMVLIALCLISAVPIQASAAEVYEGNISTSYVSIFEDIAEKKVGLFDDYVFYRSGQYDYQMVVGQLALSDNQITSDGSIQIYTISTNNANYNNIYEYSVTSGSAFSLTPNTNLIYSNLGDYPDLIERSNYYAVATLLVMLIALCIFFVRSIFSFCWRDRR